MFLSWLMSIQKQTTSERWSKIAENLSKIISPQGIVIGRSSTEVANSLKKAKFRVFNLVEGVTLAIAPQKSINLQDKQIVIVSSVPSLLRVSIANVT